MGLVCIFAGGENYCSHQFFELVAATCHRHVAIGSFESHYQIKRRDIQKDVSSFYGVGNGTRTHNARNHNPVLCQLNYTHHILFAEWPHKKVARQKGLEPLTYCLEGSCSIQLSYWRI